MTTPLSVFKLYDLSNTLLVLCIVFVVHIGSQAQPIDSTFYSIKKDSLNLIQDQIKSLTNEQKKIKTELGNYEKLVKSYPIWKSDISGIIGFNISKFNNWLSKNQSSTQASTFSYAFNSFVNLEQEKYYWNNRLNLVQSWIKFDDKDVDEEVESYQVASDNFSFNSLLAFKFSSILAFSSSLEYRTGLLEERLNNPSNLDFGVGASWKPEESTVITLHPINYNGVYSNIQSVYSFGLKSQGTYGLKFDNGFSWQSSFSNFLSYKARNLDNWLWANSIAKNFKHLGVGFDVSFKKSMQEAITRNLGDNPLQWFYIFGLSYKY